jgi:hypothetical protein
VPDQIRDLRSGDPERRTAARWNLSGNIYHQGSRYEATAYAVPFLLEVLAMPDTADRHELLGLLASITLGADEEWLPAGLPIAEHRARAAGGAELVAAGPHPGDDDFDEDEGDSEYIESLTAEQQQAYFGHVTVAAYDAVRAGVPLFRELLNDPDPSVRSQAAYLLAWFPEEAEVSLAALTVADDPEDVVRATTLVACGLLGAAPGPAALHDPHDLVRWGAAIAAGTVDGAQAAPAVVAELIKWVGSPIDADPRIPFLAGNLSRYAGLVLERAGVTDYAAAAAAATA